MAKFRIYITASLALLVVIALQFTHLQSSGFYYAYDNSLNEPIDIRFNFSSGYQYATLPANTIDKIPTSAEVLSVTINGNTYYPGTAQVVELESGTDTWHTYSLGWDDSNIFDPFL